MAQVQLDFFQELSEVDLLKQEIAEVKTRGDNIRKGLFARHNELAKLYIELKERCDMLEYKLLKKPATN